MCIRDRKTLVIAVSQSGETIDTLEAVKYAKNRVAKCLAIINVKGSSIARAVSYTHLSPVLMNLSMPGKRSRSTRKNTF